MLAAITIPEINGAHIHIDVPRAYLSKALRDLPDSEVIERLNECVGRVLRGEVKCDRDDLVFNGVWRDEGYLYWLEVNCNDCTLSLHLTDGPGGYRVDSMMC